MYKLSNFILFSTSSLNYTNYVSCRIAGDGQSECTPRANLSTELGEMYVTAGAGWLACSEGDDVEYPQGAPGFKHDPTGSRGMKVCCL